MAFNKVCVILLFYTGLGEWAVREMVFTGLMAIHTMAKQ